LDGLENVAVAARFEVKNYARFGDRSRLSGPGITLASMFVLQMTAKLKGTWRVAGA
jgi:hypothetical protein